MRNTLFAVPLALLLGACSQSVQTTSGADYLANYSRDPALLAAMDPQVRAAAEVEPVLTFPARLGLARIVNGQITPIPTHEAALWIDFAAANAGYGEFVPISPLLAAFAVADTSEAAQAATCAGCRQSAANLVQAIRIGAARQHVDAVLVYEVGATGQNQLNPLALGDLLLIGMAILPGRDLEAQGMAQAILLDVRNGYPYGTAQTVTELSRIHPTMGSDAKLAGMRDDVARAVVAMLIPEVQAMLDQLRLDLTQGQAGRPAPK